MALTGFRWLVAGLLALAFGWHQAQAQPRGDRTQAQALADAAWDHVRQAGLERACRDFTADRKRWTRMDLYVAVLDFKGQVLAHGANEQLVGRNLMALRDAKSQSFVARMIEAAQSPGGVGWVDYDWPNSFSRSIEAKTAYVRVLPGGAGLVTVGFYR